MKLRELLNTNQNDLEQIYIYFDEDQWENETPEVVYGAVNRIDKGELNSYVDAWFVDANFNIHVLIG